MPPSLLIRNDVRLVLITGSPGASKSTIAKLVFAAQTPEWRMLSLDDYFLVSQAPQPGLDGWGALEAGATTRAGILKYIADRRGKVIAEGIIQSDREVETYAAGMGLTRSSSALRFIKLECPRDEAAKRMFNRPVKEAAQENWTLEQYGRHYDWLTAKLRARGAANVSAGGNDPSAIAAAVIARINGG